MTAGREMDALVAEHVMGIVSCEEWKMLHHGAFHGGPAFGLMAGSCPVHGGHPDEPSKCAPPELWPAKYSSDIKAAWEVAEKLVSDGYGPSLVYDDHGHWALSLESAGPVGPKANWMNVILDEVQWADTAPLAICIAALRAVDVEVPA